MAKILCVLYPDPEAGYPPKYARDDIPNITRYDAKQPQVLVVDTTSDEVVRTVKLEG